MMGWVVMLVLALLVAGGLWRFIAKDTGMVQFLGAALLLALAGYAWQGRPGLAGAPKARAAADQRPPSDFSQLRRDLLGQTDFANAWLTPAESYLATGDTADAVDLIRSGIRQAPRDMDLWIGLGDALVQHAGGLLTPAAELAFNRAMQLAPQHPAPRFFYGLALARNGQFDAADGLWREALVSGQASQAWRDVITQAQELTAQARATAQSAPPAN